MSSEQHPMLKSSLYSCYLVSIFKFISVFFIIIPFDFLQGTVMEMTIAAMEQMNHQNIVRVMEELALGIFSHVTMEIAFHVFIYVTEITIVWITVMKILDINVVSISYEA